MPISEYLGAYRGKQVVGSALAEGAAFFNVLAHFLDGQLMNFGLVVVLAARIASQIPTRRRLERWLRQHWAATG